MTVFRMLLAIGWGVLAAHTAVVISREGLDLLPVFFGDITALTWSGQFNLDFLLMLALSAVWVAWRHRFSPAGMALGAGALVGGILFLIPYLLIATRTAKGDAKSMVLGEQELGNR